MKFWLLLSQNRHPRIEQDSGKSAGWNELCTMRDYADKKKFQLRKEETR